MLNKAGVFFVEKQNHDFLQIKVICAEKKTTTTFFFYKTQKRKKKFAYKKLLQRNHDTQTTLNLC